MHYKARSGLSNLEKWISENGYSGYDPYDVKGNPFIIKLTGLGNHNVAVSIFREIVFELFYTFPSLSRKISGIKPTVNAKAMGLFASSYLDLYFHNKDRQYYDKALYCLDWLKKNNAPDVQGYGWGYPFDWQSQRLIPAGTPNGIVTTAVGDAFWKHYKLSGDKESLDFCTGICTFLCTLPVDKISSDQICFSYTPLFINHVHNLNLFVAEFLIKTGTEIRNNEWMSMGHKALQYTISNQLENGAFDYNGPPEKPADHFDNYHTGFVLRMLYSIWKLTGREDVLASLTRCYRQYTSHFFEDNRIPKLMPDKKYRIDIHSCAESINCLSVLGNVFPEGLELAENILEWTVHNLQDESGYFYYGIVKSRFTGTTFKSKIPYIRWGQAWMFRALSSYLISSDQKKS
ncbi:MAG: hypothetical protein JXB19_11470 [Bacteroidales bacterium]|nr:hypothetical protein [Bacteroidales bacterium]